MTLSSSVDIDHPDSDIVDRLSALPTPNIGDAMGRLNVVDGGIRAVWTGAKIAGPAYPVLVAPGDNLGIHEALKAAARGFVLVINGGAFTERALMGDLIGERAISAGLRGFVIDGAVRDASTLGEIGMPVFARATSPAGPFKNGPYRLDTSVALGGVVVNPGDIVIGDDDGLVVVPADEAAEVAEAAEAVYADEDQRRSSIIAARTN
ncbi:regulator of RNase E activity RraA [Brevibacterium epidermidis]|jgi:regulator of RNase E activity RraA|uniref:Putative 4-hydroxy-4-methyl-2-oxoglutarate aldolase n=1 Tax=Brevibacterium epidermidis TaxID=1698 RepID=A0ABV4EM79_BREEP